MNSTRTSVGFVLALGLAMALLTRTASAQNPVPEGTIDFPGVSFVRLLLPEGKWLITDPGFLADPMSSFWAEGQAYLYDAEGNLLKTLDNPNPDLGRGFGQSAAFVGTNFIAIGAPWVQFGGPGEWIPGAVHLFDLDGTFVRTIENPEPNGPGLPGSMGSQVVAFGPDKLLVGTSDINNPNAAYLFDTNGVRLATFQNFDYNAILALGAVGEELVFIQWWSDWVGVGDLGVFDPTGMAVPGFAGPGGPGAVGLPVVSLGSERVLLREMTDPWSAQGALLFSASTGELVQSFTNPDPGSAFPLGMVSLSGERALLTSSQGAYVFDANGNLLGGLVEPEAGGPVIPLGDDHYATDVSAMPGATSLAIYSVPATVSGAPVVLRNPESQTNRAGTAASLSVLAAGSPPLSYLWLKDGAPISDDAETLGAQLPTLTLSNVNGSDSGAYAVAVSNPSGSTTSLVAILVVMDPVIVNRSFPRVVPLGGNLVLSVEAAGTAPLTYLWTKDGSTVTAGTESTFSISNAQLSDAGDYNVTVTNSLGEDTQEPLRVAVTAAYADDFNPQPVFVAPGPSRFPGTVDAIAIQRDGRILAGGRFGEVLGAQKANMARFSAMGDVDMTFSPFIQYPIDWIGVAVDGRIMTGESSVDSFWPMLYRFLPSGLVDPAFTIPQYLPPSTRRFLQPDGRIIVATGGGPDLVVRRLNQDGTEDDSFGMAFFGPPFASRINCLALQRDGKILVGGTFTEVNGGVAHWGLVRLNADGTVDEAFNPTGNWQFAGWVDALAVQPDGRILVAGMFEEVGGKASEGIARLNPDGTADPGFTASVNLCCPGLYVNTMVLQADGRIILGGTFDMLNNQPIPYLGRLDANGSTDMSFFPVPDGEVTSLALQPDGRLLVGGNFITLAGESRPGFGRLVNTVPAEQSMMLQGSTVTWLQGGSSPAFWHAAFESSLDGVTWTSLGTATPVPEGWQVSAGSTLEGATVRARGYVMTGKSGSGWVSESVIGAPAVLTQPASRTNNATTTATFNVEALGADPLTYQWRKNGVNLSDAGNVSGSTTSTLTLTNILGVDAGDYTVVVANASGSRTSLVASLTVRDPWISSSLNTRWVVQNLPDPGNRLIVGISPAGTPPFTFQWRKGGQVVPGATASTLVISNAQISDSGRYEGIAFNAYGSATGFPAYVTVVPSRPEAALNPGAQGSGATVLATAVQPDGSLIVGGTFARLSGAISANLGRLTPTGTFDPSFSTALGSSPNGTVRALAVQPDGNVLVGGEFQKLIGNLVSPVPPALLGRLKPDGSLDGSFNPRIGWFMFPGFVSAVNALALQPDGKILVGGNFTEVGGQERAGFARLSPDGSLDTSFAANAGTGGSFGEQVRALVLQPDGKILVGGTFETFSGVPRQNLARLNNDGSLDLSFNPRAAETSNLGAGIYALALQPDGEILVGGLFGTLAGQPRTNLARLNPDGSLDETFRQNVFPPNRPVRSLALQADGKVFVGGRFQNWDGAIRRFGRLNADGTPDTTFLNDVTLPQLVDRGEDVYTIALQNDGRLVVGGRFTEFSGSQFNVNNLGRLPAVSVPTDQLAFGVGRVDWLRAGAIPEVWQVTFEASADGTAWSPLGTGTQVADGWQLGGVSIPKGTRVRARGWVIAGGANAWLVQKVAEVPNLPPVADASATQPLLISPNGASATVILDGSRSSDPDGDPLQFAWYESGNLLAEGAVAVKELPVGIHTIQLVVHDGELSATNAIGVEVLTAVQAVERIQAAAAEGVARSQPLLGTLSAAIASIDRSNPASAINQLLAFQNKVRAQVAPLDPALADSLIQAAQQVIEALLVAQNSPSSQGRGRLSNLRKHSDGTLSMEFSADPDGVYVLESSTDLVHWDRIAVAARLPNGSMGCMEKPARTQSQKFYRVVRIR